jgi:lipase
MRAMGIGPSVIVGHSMGAYVATVLAAAEPDLAAGLVLLDGGHPPELPPGLDSDALLDRILGPVIERLHQTFPSREAYFDVWRELPLLSAASGQRVWGPWVEEYLAYDLGGQNGSLRPKAAEAGVRAGVRADFADMGNQVEAERRLGAVQAPIMVIRAENGLSPGEPGVLAEPAMDRIRRCAPDIVEYTIAETTHYTIVLTDPGASTVAELLVEFAAECGV